MEFYKIRMANAVWLKCLFTGTKDVILINLMNQNGMVANGSRQLLRSLKSGGFTLDVCGHFQMSILIK